MGRQIVPMARPIFEQIHAIIDSSVNTDLNNLSRDELIGSASRLSIINQLLDNLILLVWNIGRLEIAGAEKQSILQEIERRETRIRVIDDAIGDDTGS